uniref:Homoserine dehydrogenase catalytic domain-containing protein n=1 Tax=Oryza glumipatula TaxID=40148 RepID=A0A0D9Y8H5_9ORYZ
MVEYILGVPDPLQWHSERNPAHYSGWMARLGPITRLANNIGIGVTPEDGGVRVSHPAALSPQPAAGLSFSLRRTGTPPSTTAVGRSLLSSCFQFSDATIQMLGSASVTRIIASGDPICLLWFSHIVGSLSGTLSYVMSELEDGNRFSEFVKTTKSLGYTEPCENLFIHLWHYKINVYSVFIRCLSLLQFS